FTGTVCRIRSTVGGAAAVAPLAGVDRLAGGGAQGGGVPAVVPDISRTRPVPVHRAAGALAGVHDDRPAGTQVEGAGEGVDVVCGVADRTGPKVHGVLGLLGELGPLVVEARVAAGVGAGGVVLDTGELHRRRGRRGPSDGDRLGARVVGEHAVRRVGADVG